MPDDPYRDRRRALADTYLQEYWRVDHGRWAAMRNAFDAGYDAGYQDRDRAVVALREALTVARRALDDVRCEVLDGFRCEMCHARNGQEHQSDCPMIAVIDILATSPEAGREESGGE